MTGPLSAQTKPWQHGYDLDYLKSIEAHYAEYNKYACGNPFAEYKKNRIAEDLSKGDLKLSNETGCIDTPIWRVKRVKVKGNIVAYDDVVIGHKEPGDNVYSHIACSNAMFKNWFMITYGTSWVYSWREDQAKHEMLLSIGYKYIGGKIDTYGSIMGIYFREDSMPASIYALPGTWEPRKHPVLSPLEKTGVKRVLFRAANWKAIKDFGLHITNQLPDGRRFDISYTDHYSNYNKERSWSALALRGYKNDYNFIEKPIEMNAKWQEKHKNEKFFIQNTYIMPFFEEHVKPILKSLGQDDYTNVHRIRLMKLKPGGGELERHTDQVDPDLGATPGKLARFHFPLVTNPGVEFTSWDFDGKATTVNMKEGECWYLDIRKPHRAINNGTEDRIHLVVDIVLTPELIQRMENAE